MRLPFLDRTASAIIRAASFRAKLLTPDIVRRYADGILKKRDLFNDSAIRFGTPQYFYDETALDNSIERFKDSFKRYLKCFQMFYAMKSNHLRDLCEEAVRLGAGLDVSSGIELNSALSLNCKRIIFSGPGKTDEELSLVVRNSRRVTLMMDSHGEYERLAYILKRDGAKGRKLSTGIRIKNTRKESWNKFGIPLDELGYFLKTIKDDDLVEASGIQFHSSWNLGPEVQVGLINDIGRHLRYRIPGTYLENFRFLDIGGGYWPDHGEWLNPENTVMGKLIRDVFPKVKFDDRHYYFKSAGLDTFARKISSAVEALGEPLNKLEVWTEPGRWISTRSMHILVRVIDVKKTGEVITDGGINSLGWERPLTEYIPVINLTSPSMTEKKITIFGSLCAPEDIWGRHIFAKNIKRNDILIIPDQGAYTYSLRQGFIKPVPRIIKYNGKILDEIKGEEGFLSR